MQKRGEEIAKCRQDKKPKIKRKKIAERAKKLREKSQKKG